MSSGITYHVRKHEQRGGSDDLGWLETCYSFSVPGYMQKEYSSFGTLKVLNEDRVQPYTGFGLHGHREFEIFSYIVSGELEHQDSMHNIEILKRGDIQLTSAGTGIRHSEKAHGDKQVHFLQIWTSPSISNLTPKYFTRHFTDDEKKNKWARLVAPIQAPGVKADRNGSGPAPVQSPITLFGTLLDPKNLLTHVLPAESSANRERKVYIHVIQTSGYNTAKAKGAHVKVNGQVGLQEGDGLFASGVELSEIEIINVGDQVAEIVLFEVGDD